MSAGCCFKAENLRSCKGVFLSENKSPLSSLGDDRRQLRTIWMYSSGPRASLLVLLDHGVGVE